MKNVSAVGWSVPKGKNGEAVGADLWNFLETAHAENFQPRQRDIMEITVGDPAHRMVVLICRGRLNGYEPFLWDQGQPLRLGPYYGLRDTGCVCVRPPFYSTGYFALEWMRGNALEEILPRFEFVDSIPAGLVLASQYYDLRDEDNRC